MVKYFLIKVMWGKFFANCLPLWGHPPVHKLNDVVAISKIWPSVPGSKPKPYVFLVVLLKIFNFRPRMLIHDTTWVLFLTSAFSWQKHHLDRVATFNPCHHCVWNLWRSSLVGAMIALLPQPLNCWKTLIVAKTSCGNFQLLLSGKKTIWRNQMHSTTQQTT